MQHTEMRRKRKKQKPTNKHEDKNLLKYAKWTIISRNENYIITEPMKFINQDQTWREPLIHCWPLEKSHELGLGKDVVEEERCLTVKSTFPTSPNIIIRQSKE